MHMTNSDPRPPSDRQVRPQFPGVFQTQLQRFNIGGRAGWVLLAVLLIIGALGLLGQQGVEALSYSRPGLAHGQWWRLLSGHWVHLNWHHTLLNCAGLVLMWVLFAAEYSPARWLLIVLASMVAIDAGLWFLRPQVEWYVGASGALHGVLAAGALAQLRRRELTGVVLMLALVLKLAHEQQSGVSMMAPDLPVVVDAHLYGAWGGLAAAIIRAPRRGEQTRKTT